MFSNMFTDEELQSAKEHYERAAGVQHHLSRNDSEAPKCHCGRPAAERPNPLQLIFQREKFAAQNLAAQAQKCVPCYEMDLYLEQVDPRKSIR